MARFLFPQKVHFTESLKHGYTLNQGFTLNQKFQEHTLIQNKILRRTAETETVPMKFIFVLVHFLGSSYSKSIPALNEKFQHTLAQKEKILVKSETLGRLKSIPGLRHDRKIDGNIRNQTFS
jgi:hypothetical protein